MPITACNATIYGNARKMRSFALRL